jgi:outer membrane protein TolC
MGQQPLTLRQAIDLATGQNQEAAIAKASEQEAEAEAAIARTRTLPQLSSTEDISRGDDPVYAFGTHLRQQQFTQDDFALNNLNRPRPIGNFATRFSGSWIAFDSFKTQKEIRRADLIKQATHSLARAVDQQIVLRVVEAYQSILYAQREIDVAQHEQETVAALEGSVEEHVKAGLAVEADLMSARVNVASRKQELIVAQGSLEEAWADLRDAVGVPDLKKSELRPIEPHTFPEQTLEQEVAAALSKRADLMSLEQAQAAQQSAVSAAKSDFGPRVSAYGNWEQDRTTFAGSGGNNWLAGVQISVDILPMAKRAQLAKEKSAQRQIDAQQKLLDQHIRLQVNRAHIHRETAELSVQTARAPMDEAAESLRILENRYSAGLATMTDLLRAEDAVRHSQSSYWHAVYDNVMAYAELLYATGMLTPDAAEELQ